MGWKEQFFEGAATRKTDASNPNLIIFGIAPVGYDTPEGWASNVWILYGTRTSDGTEVHANGDILPNKSWDNRGGFKYT